MSDSVSISIRLGNRQYKLKVDSKNEEIVRQIILEINQKTSKLKTDFPGRDEQDYLAMTLIDYITSNAEQKPEQVNSKPIDENLVLRLQTISTLLDA